MEITRLSPQLGDRQLLWLVVGDVVLLVTCVWPRNVNWLRLYKYTWAFIGFGLIALTIVHGSDIGNSGYRRWIGFGGVYLQPVEFLKIFMVIFFAAYLDEKRELLSGRSVEDRASFVLPPFQYLHSPPCHVGAFSASAYPPERSGQRASLPRHLPGDALCGHLPRNLSADWPGASS